MGNARVIYLPFTENAIWVAIGVVVEGEASQVSLLASFSQIIKLLSEELPLATVNPI